VTGCSPCLVVGLNAMCNREDEIVNSILEQINNDIIDAYKEKERIYNNVLDDKNNNQDNEVISYLEDKILELSTL